MNIMLSQDIKKHFTAFVCVYMVGFILGIIGTNLLHKEFQYPSNLLGMYFMSQADPDYSVGKYFCRLRSAPGSGRASLAGVFGRQSFDHVSDGIWNQRIAVGQCLFCSSVLLLYTRYAELFFHSIPDVAEILEKAEHRKKALPKLYFLFDGHRNCLFMRYLYGELCQL